MVQPDHQPVQVISNEPISKSEDIYATLIEQSQDGIITIQDGIIKFANSRFARITEYDIDELLGMEASIVLSRQSRECLEQRKQDLMLGKELKHIFQMEILTQTGRVIIVEANVSLIDYNDEMMDSLMLRETDQRETVAATSKQMSSGKSDDWLHSILEGSPNLILVVDRDGTIKFANHGSADRPKEDLQETSLFNYIDPECHGVVTESLKDVFESGRQDYFITRIVKEDGTNIWCETQAGPVKKNEEIVAVSLVNTDITERKRREERIEAKYQEVEVRSYQMEAANSEMQHNQMQLIELNQKLLESQSRLSETMTNLREAQADPSTSVIQLWDKILMLPFLSIKNSQQAREMMDNLISKITETQAETVMLDINGIASIDNFLIRILSETMSMAQMMGAKAIVVGSQPEIAVVLKEYGINVEKSA